MTNIRTFRSRGDYYFLINNYEIFYLNIENIDKKDNIFQNLNKIQYEKIAKKPNKFGSNIDHNYHLSLRLHKDSNNKNHYLFFNDDNSSIITIKNESKIKKYIDGDNFISFHFPDDYDYQLYIEFSKIGIVSTMTYSLEREDYNAGPLR